MKSFIFFLSEENFFCGLWSNCWIEICFKVGFGVCKRVVVGGVIFIGICFVVLLGIGGGCWILVGIVFVLGFWRVILKVGIVGVVIIGV